MKLKSPIKIFTDFDGTITKVDSLNMVLDEFAQGDWRAIEDRVTLHELSEKDALQMEFDLVNASFEKVITFIENKVEIDVTFKSFVDWCQTQKIELVVLSGGFKEFINKVFKKYDINNLPIFSNSISVQNNRWKVVQSDLPKIKNLCNHCKTNHLIQAKEQGFQVIYIGDGNTDRCPALSADLVFAKGSLKKYLQSMNKSYCSFNNFNDINQQLQSIYAHQK